jgi:predicted Zn-dependent protease
MSDSDRWWPLLEEDPDNELIRFSYAKALYDEKKWALAVPHFTKLVEADPEYALAWAFLARAAFEAGDRERARKACQDGYPIAKKQCHEIPLDEIESVLRDLESDF